MINPSKLLKRLVLGPFGLSLDKLTWGHALRWRDWVLTRRSHIVSVYSRIHELEATVKIHERGSARVRSAKRSVAFLNNSYYNFYYLARALRKRGWDAVSVSYDDPKGPNGHYLHGWDIGLYDADPEVMSRNIARFFEDAVGRFGMIHFYGRGHMSIFPSERDSGSPYNKVPITFMRLRQHGVKIGYSVSGCLDGVAQSSVHRWSGCCNRCVWQNAPLVCSDKGNLAWGHKVEMFCDVICCEGFPALDFQTGDKAYREPVTTALDPEFWRPDLPIPERFRLPREAGELIVYHAVGNFALRSAGGRNLKGTPAVVAAIERLRSEGIKVRLEFVTDLPNTEVRYIQAQADVIVDQLNYGRYGATAREGMMLGKPTICYIHKNEPEGERKLNSIETCPLVSANEETVYSVLRELLGNERLRRDIGARSRAFALKWHSEDACAERFEALYDRLQLGLAPEVLEYA